MNRSKGSKVLIRKGKIKKNENRNACIGAARFAVFLLLFSACENGDEFSLPTPQPIIEGDRVLVPAGNVILGNTPDGWGNYPQPGDPPIDNPVFIDSFYIDRYEVTNEQYASFLTEAFTANMVYLSGNPEFDVYRIGTGLLLLQMSSDFCQINFNGTTEEFIVKDENESLPVVEVSWHGASFYAEYYGERLPTEQEWEKAARGIVDVFGSIEGVGVGYPYPWGDALPTASLANFNQIHGAPSRVDAYPTGMSWFGAFNMAGNVWEWTATTIGTNRVLRGGGYISDAELLRTAYRSLSDPVITSRDIGFRCAADP